MKFHLTTSTLKSFYLFETWFETHLLIIANRFFFFVSMIISIDRIRKSFNISAEFSNRFCYFYSTSFLISVFELFVLFESFQKLHLLIQQIDFDSSTFVMKLITFRIQISNQFFIFLSSLFDISTRTQYWDHFFSSRTSRDHIDFICKESCFFRFDVEFNIVSSKTTKIFEHISTRIISLFREVFKNTFNCLANWFFFSIFSMTSIFDRFEIFNSTFSYDWFEDELFNQIANFLQHFQQCLHLYCESKLLDLLIIVLADFVNAWFDDQSKFISLHDFDIVLTKTFSSSKSVMIQSTLKFEVSKFKKTSKTEQIVKSTSTLQNIDIFDSTLTFDEFEFDLYKEVASFLQYLQQCQHLYRKSDLLNLLSKCLCDFAFEWFKTQSEFISLKRFNRVLTKAFSKTFLRRVSSRNSNLQINTLDDISESMKNASNQQIVQMNCKICKQNFNFNEKLYEHIRKHEALKLVKNSSLSINAVNLVCEIEKRSFASQKSHDSFTRSQKSIFESAVAFEAVTLLKRSTLQSLALETTSESTKRLSACRHCKQTFNFKKMLRQHKREQHAKRFVVNSHLLIDVIKSTCESIKISTINSSFFASFAIQSKQMSEFFTFFESIVSFKNSFFTNSTFETICQFSEKSAVTLLLFASLDIFNSIQSHQNLEKRRFNQIVIFIQHLQQCQHLYCESKLLEWMKVIFCDFVDIWFENQSNFIFLHDFDIVLTKTFSTFIFTHVSFASFAKSRNSIFKSTATFKSIILLKRSNLLLFTLKIESKSTKRSTTCRHCKQTFKFKKKFRKHKREQHAKKFVINSSFRSYALKSICKAKKKSTVKNMTILFALQELQISNQKIDTQKHSIVNSLLLIDTIKSTCEIAKKSTIASIAKFSKSTSEEKAESRIRTCQNSNLEISLIFESRDLVRSWRSTCI